MDIRMLDARTWKRLEVFVQRMARQIGKGRLQAGALNSVVAFGTEIHLQIAREPCRIEDQ